MQKTRETEKTKDGEDLLRAYFDQIKRTPLLSFEEELDLSRRIQVGDELARRRLIEANLRLVVKIAKEFSSPDIQFIDLIQEGNIGLIKAASRYDHARNVRFCTYASWWIKQSIRRAIANKARAIRLPHRKEEVIKRIQDAQITLMQRLSREPSTAEVAKAVKMTESKVAELMSMNGGIASLDAETQADSGSLIDLFEDYTYSPDREFVKTCVREKTVEFLETLMDKERKILMYRFEFFGGKRYTLKKIGSVMGLSPETVRQIELKALRKLAIEAKELKDYIYS
jgi:RNA polymerase primary sigma factor